jgi:hypothetical protein
MKHIEYILILIYSIERVCFYTTFDYTDYSKDELYNIISMNHIHHINVFLSLECIKDVTNFGYIYDTINILLIFLGIIKKKIYLVLFFDFILRFAVIIKYAKKLGMNNFIFSFPVLNIIYLLIFMTIISSEMNKKKIVTKIIEAKIIKYDITKFISEKRERKRSITPSKRRKSSN